MKIRLLKDWNWHKAGDVTDVFDPLANDWILNGVAEPFVETRAVQVERATSAEPQVESAMISEKRRMPKR